MTLSFYIIGLLFVTRKDIGQVYKHIQSQISTLSIKKPVSLCSEPQQSVNVCPFCDRQTSKQLYLSFPKTIQNDATIPNNEDIQSCETPKNRIIAFQPFEHLIIIHNV